MLYAITSNVAGDDLMSKTLDMKGRTEAVALMNKMADGFDGINVPDPNKLKPFIEAVTGSVMAIMEVKTIYLEQWLATTAPRTTYFPIASSTSQIYLITIHANRSI